MPTFCSEVLWAGKGALGEERTRGLSLPAESHLFLAPQECQPSGFEKWMKFQWLNFVTTIINIIITNMTMKIPTTTIIIILIILNITVHITNFTTNKQPRLALLLLLSLGGHQPPSQSHNHCHHHGHLTLYVTNNNIMIRITVIIAVSPVIVIPTTVFTTTSSITSFYTRLSPRYLQFYITPVVITWESHHEQVPPGPVLFHPVCSNREGVWVGGGRGSSPFSSWRSQTTVRGDCSAPGPHCKELLTATLGCALPRGRGWLLCNS